MSKLKLLFLVLFVTNGYADSVNVKVGSKVDHIAKGEWNEDNKLLGIEYQHNDSVILEYSEFVNSYGKDTKFTMVSLQYLPLEYKKAKIGAGISLGYQEGYCHKGFATTRCKDGMEDTSPLALYYATTEIDNFIIRYTYIPNSVEIMTFAFKAIEW